MKVKVSWSNQYSKKDIEWKVNEAQIIEEGMKKIEEKMKQDRLKLIRGIAVFFETKYLYFLYS